MGVETQHTRLMCDLNVTSYSNVILNIIINTNIRIFPTC